MRDKLIEIGFNVRDKDTHFMQRRGHASGICGECGKKATFRPTKAKMPKANCDVELTVDCLELAGPNVEFLIFTGDGDFRYLLEKLIEKGVRIRLLSTSKTDQEGNYRLSTRLKELLSEHEANKTGMLLFTELNNIRNRIGEDI